jgi:hypothetical protein
MRCGRKSRKRRIPTPTRRDEPCGRPSKSGARRDGIAIIVVALRNQPDEDALPRMRNPARGMITCPVGGHSRSPGVARYHGGIAAPCGSARRNPSVLARDGFRSCRSSRRAAGPYDPSGPAPPGAGHDARAAARRSRRAAGRAADLERVPQPVPAADAGPIIAAPQAEFFVLVAASAYRKGQLGSARGGPPGHRTTRWRVGFFGHGNTDPTRERAHAVGGRANSAGAK